MEQVLGRMRVAATRRRPVLRFASCLWVMICCSTAGFAQQPKANEGATISGVVKDVGGTVVSAAHVILQVANPAEKRETFTDVEGRYRFSGIPPSDFTLTVIEQGLETEIVSGALHPGEQYDQPAIVLRIATASTTVDVSLTRDEIAEEDVRGQEQQRVLGLVPNFFVTFKKDPVPLRGKQKFRLALRTTVDPSTFVIAGIAAGVEQANNSLPGYGSGAASFGKRYGATYANSVSATILRDAFFPSLLHQDPRYYYKGTGSKLSRAGYALSTAFICKGDNGRWQPNYSSLLGNLSAGALTNLYYPPGSRNGASTTFENGLLTTAGVGIGHLLQEFLYSKLTAHRHTDTVGAQSPTVPAR